MSRTSNIKLPDTEPGLIAKAQSGDTGAYEQLYRTHVGRVYSLCLKMTGKQDAAEEATQEAFIRAWEKLPDFAGKSTFGTWVHRIAVNTVLMSTRQDVRYRKRVALYEDVEEREKNSTGSGIATQTIHMDLEQAMSSLPVNARTVFILHEVEGYRHDEIAEMTGVTIGTSKSQLHRARKLLQEYLNR